MWLAAASRQILHVLFHVRRINFLFSPLSPHLCFSLSGLALTSASPLVGLVQSSAHVAWLASGFSRQATAWGKSETNRLSPMEQGGPASRGRSMAY